MSGSVTDGAGAAVGAGGSRKIFVVGRLTRSSAEIQLAEGRSVLAGAFLMKAVVKGGSAGGRPTVH